MPFFSVVIPLYNKASWIGATLDSVLGQSFQDFELLVINNGSTDGSEQVVESYQDNRIRLFHQENGGVSRARNAGILEAKAHFIAFLDADDLWAPAFLEQLHQLIQQYPEATAYGCQYAFRQKYTDIPPHQPLLSGEKMQLIDNYFDQVAAGDMLLTASSVCIPKKWFTKVGLFPEGERIGEDQDMWARLALAGPLAFHGSCAAYYRQEVGGMATAARPEAQLWPFVERLLHKLRSGRIPQNLEPSVRRYAVRQLLGQASQLVLDGQQKAAGVLLAIPEARSGGKRFLYWKFVNQLPAFLLFFIKKRHG